MPTFRSRTPPPPAAASPEALFDDLPKTPDGAASLWAHQADVLRDYADHHVGSSDIALELPTGAGKTLPALLIAEWRRTARGERVAYACPTHQLAHQVADEATKHGIYVSRLIGGHVEWETPATMKYEGARAVAVTTYANIFNSRPWLAQPATLIFDDAHAGEQFVAQAWSLSIKRSHEPDLYSRVVGAVAPELSELHLQRLRDPNPDPRTRRHVDLLPIGALARRLLDLDREVSLEGGNTSFRYAMIRERLDRCLVFLSWEGILIRPYIPPTFGHALFRDATQRVYVSATLGEGGELERAFGRAAISRLPVPPGWDRRGSGRRFFVFADLVKEAESRVFTRTVIDRARKALLISPSDHELSDALATLVADDLRVFGKGEIDRGLEAFSSAPSGVLGLANRYDGMDLPDAACRLTVLDGAPAGAHLQERFLVETLGAARVLEDRMRTRVVQGAGRCTRGLKDHSVVVVLGDNLTRFVSRKEVLDAMRPEIQAEIRFGIENSETLAAEVHSFISSFLAQDDSWREQAEPALADLRREATMRLPDGTAALAAAATEEVRAYERLWDGDLDGASQLAHRLTRHLTPESLRPYRALWTYLASAWLELSAIATDDVDKMTAARDLLEEAREIAPRSSWLRDVGPREPGAVSLTPLDAWAVKAISDSRLRRMSAAQWDRLSTDLQHGCRATDPALFEPALTRLGELLGARAFKPSGQARADCVWLFDELCWFTIEAKSAADETGSISARDVRQANAHLRLLSADEKLPIPDESASILLSPRQVVHPDAVASAESHVYTSSPGEVVRLATDALGAWDRVRALGHGLSDEAVDRLVAQEFSGRRVLPADVRDRLLDNPIAG